MPPHPRNMRIWSFARRHGLLAKQNTPDGRIVFYRALFHASP